MAGVSGRPKYMLKQLLQRQKAFQLRFYNPDLLTQEEKVKWTKEFILCTHQELAEVMNTMDWKSYHMYDKEYSTQETKDEIIDCLKFVFNLAIVWGMDHNEIFELFNKKSDLVEQRLKIK